MQSSHLAQRVLFSRCDALTSNYKGIRAFQRKVNISCLQNYFPPLPPPQTCERYVDLKYPKALNTSWCCTGMQAKVWAAWLTHGASRHFISQCKLLATYIYMHVYVYIYTHIFRTLHSCPD